MKKIIAVAAVGMLVLGGVTSCTKDYTCTWTSNGVSYSQDYLDQDKDQAAALETDCNNLGGTWSTK